MINLSDLQKQIINVEIGKPIQVLASAGTGKTRVLTERIRHILQERKKEKIIALTFTNAAAQEMQLRLDGIETKDRCWISTIHSIAQRILEQYSNTIGLPSDLHIYERDQDRKTVFIQSLINNGIDVDTFLNSYDIKDRNKKIQKYMDFFSSIKRQLLTQGDIKKDEGEETSMWSIFQAYQETLVGSGGIDFDDIFVYAHKILLEHSWCGNVYRAMYKHIFIDEAQDLNKAQYEFIKLLCGDQIKSIMMVGDPNQMIYGFNGSSHEFFCEEFAKDFLPIKFELRENYRSTASVVKLANKLKPNSQIKTDFAFLGKSEINSFATEEDEATWICEKILHLLALKTDPEIEGGIALSKIVVIARNRFMFEPLKKALKSNNIYYSHKEGEQQPEPTSIFGKVLDLSIRLKINSKDWIDEKKLHSVLKISSSQGSGIGSMIETLSNNMNIAKISLGTIQLDLLKAVQKLDTEKPNILKMCNDLERQLKNLAGSNSNEIEAELERSFQELDEFRTRWISFKRKGLGESLSAFRSAMALGKIFLEDNTNGLLLSTVHTMKGLERDIVFLMSMCEGVFPDYRASTIKEINEERNNAFVAVTRARRWIYITHPQQMKMPWGDIKAQKASRFIKEMLE